MAGGRVLLAVEQDANAVETYRLNFPEARVHHGDIAMLSADAAIQEAGLPGPGVLDILDGSPPCQGFSMAGRRRLGDPRNGLFREFCRLLRGLRPRLFVMENVSGMVKGEMKAVFDEALGELRSCGYRVRCRLLNAWWYGVPQSRERLFFVGVREDLGVEPVHPAPSAARPVTAAEALLGVPVDAAERSWLLEQGAKSVWFGEWPALPPGRLLRRVRERRDRSDLSGFSTSKLHPDKPARTVTKSDGLVRLGGMLHWAEPRKPTLAEFKRFASFPDDFAFAGSWGDAVARIGNSVPPLLAKAVAEAVRDGILFPASGKQAEPAQG